MDHSRSPQRCVAAIILAALCVLSIATAHALAPEKYGRSVNFRFRRASQTTSAKAYDNSAFIKTLKTLDAAKGRKGYTLDDLKNICHFAFQPGAVYPDFAAYGKEYMKEFEKVKNDISAVYDIKAWGHNKEKDLGEVARLVTGFVSSEEDIPCPNGFVTGKCSMFKIKKYTEGVVFDAQIDCEKMFTDEFALSVYGKSLWKDDPRKSGRCVSKVARNDGFMGFDPKGTLPALCNKKKARLSLALKETSPLKRPKALFGILKTLLLDNDVKGVLKSAKIESMTPLRDSIILQLCYDPADDGPNKIKALARTLTTRLSSFAADLSDDGPYFQEKVDAFFLADYSHGSSWGADVCCLWAGLDTTDQLVHTLKLYQSPLFGSEMAGDAYPALVQTRSKPKCRLLFKPFTVTETSVKGDFKKEL